MKNINQYFEDLRNEIIDSEGETDWEKLEETYDLEQEIYELLENEKDDEFDSWCEEHDIDVMAKDENGDSILQDWVWNMCGE